MKVDPLIKSSRLSAGGNYHSVTGAKKVGACGRILSTELVMRPALQSPLLLRTGGITLELVPAFLVCLVRCRWF
jgi:hypothetical protein